MRVPTIDQPSVSPSGAPEYSPKLRAPDPSIEQGLESIGQGMSSVIKGAEEAQAKADALRETESLTAYRHQVNSGLVGDRSSQGITDAAFNGEKAPTGFLNTRGTEASAQSAEVLDQLEKKRQEIAGQLNDRQRKAFLERSAVIYEDARRTVEGHTSQQFKAAQVATAEAAKQAALDEASAGGGRGLAPSRVADVEKSIKDLALSPEDAAADLAKFHQDVAVATISSQLASGDVETAAAQLELDREKLGRHYPAVKHQVELAQKTAKTADLHAAASEQVAKLADSVRDVDTYVTERAMREKAQRPPAGPARDAFDKAFEQQAKLEHDKLEAAKDVERNNADLADLHNVPIPEGTVKFLEKYDSKYLKGIARDQRAEARAWRAMRDGSAREKREAAAAQKAFDDEVEQLYRAELVDNPSTKHEVFIRDLLAEREGDLAVSPLAKAKMKREGAEAAKGADSKMSAATRSFVDDYGTELKSKMKPSGKGAKVDDELLQKRKGVAAQQYQQWVENNGGKALDAKAIAELKARLLKDATRVTEKSFLGWKYNSTEKVQGVDLMETAPSAPPPAPVKMRFKNGQEFDVAPDKVDAAKKKGGVVING